MKLECWTCRWSLTDEQIYSAKKKKNVIKVKESQLWSIEGGGGLIRDHQGKWIKGYMRHIRIAFSVTAELWALMDGLRLASQLDISHILVELDDAKTVVDLLHSTKASINSFSSLLNDCKYLLRQFHQARIRHVFREANKRADYLAKGGCTFAGTFVVLDFPYPEELCNILNSDASGLYSLRLIANTSHFMASLF